MVTFLPSEYPVWLKPWRNALTAESDSSGDLLLRNPTTGVGRCCARTANGHDATDPAIPVMKSRRLIVSPASGLCQFWLSTRVIKAGNDDQQNRVQVVNAMRK